MKTLLTREFTRAAQDYYYLLDSGYPQKSILKLVSDKFGLNRYQRILLYRGISSSTAVSLRNSKTISKPEKASLHIDAYNVLFTISNYILGRTVFISNDGFLRDTGEVFRKFSAEKLFEQVIKMVFDYLHTCNLDTIRFYLDSPVSYSGELAVYLNAKIEQYGLSGDATAVKSPDHVLKRLDQGVVATSDSAIMDQTGASVTDLPMHILSNYYQPDFIDLRLMLSGNDQIQPHKPG